MKAPAHQKTMRRAALAAAALQLRHFGRIRQRHVESKSLNDFVTFVDRQSQDLIVRELKKAFPDYGVVAEESAVKDFRERTWVIDPLDGTVNFIHAIPAFSISIALVENNRPIEGLVYDPIHKEWFTATRGRGAHLNGRALHVSRTSRLLDALIVTGFPFRSQAFFEPYHESFRRIFYASSGLRRIGSAALDLCFTACGRVDGFWEFGLKEWDMAAGALIVEEAGGKVSDFKGKPQYLFKGDIVAGNPTVHKALTAILKRVPGFP